MQSTTSTPAVKPNPRLACACGAQARWDRRPTRAWYRERIKYPECGLATVFSYAGPNGEHRPELLGLWDQVADGAGRDCRHATETISDVTDSLDEGGRQC
jgi:hypothetical protein